MYLQTIDGAQHDEREDRYLCVTTADNDDEVHQVDSCCRKDQGAEQVDEHDEAHREAAGLWIK